MALALSLVLVLLPSAVGGQAASASGIETVVWPVTELDVEPSYEDLLGINVTSTTPTVDLRSEDETEPVDGYLTYSYELELQRAGVPVNIASVTMPGQRFSSTTYGEWEVPEGLLEVDETYGLRFRVLAGTDQSVWSPWATLNVVGLSAAPTMVNPADGIIGEDDPTLTAMVTGFDPTIETSVIFVVESNWANGAPTEIASEWVYPDEFGIASFTPDLSRFVEGHFRWRVKSFGPGNSEWSEFREFYVGTKPNAVNGLEVLQEHRTLDE